MTMRLPLAWLAVCAALLAGCAGAPPTRYYTLSGPPAPPAPASASLSLMVGPVAIPPVVDRPQIVVTVGDNEVWLDEFNRWAAPLADGIALATAEYLAADLGTPNVTLLAQTAGAAADYRVAIEVQRFDSVPGSHALLDAVYSVRRAADGRVATGRTTDRQALADRSYDTLAAAHSRAVARLARDIAGSLRTLAGQPPGPAARAGSSPAR